MTGSVALDVVIGLIFVFLLYSLLASVLHEIISVWMGLRSRVLKKGIIRMLDDGLEEHAYRKGIGGYIRSSIMNRLTTLKHVFISHDPKKGSLAESFYNHPLVKYLGEDRKSKPAYLSSNNFSKVMVDLITGMKNKPGDDYAQQIHLFFDGLPTDAEATVPADSQSRIQPETQQFLASLWADAQGDVERFKFLLENWFDDTMERTSGWYKQYTQWFLFLIGLTIAVTFNVDAISIAGKLKKDPKMRELMIRQAETYLKEHPDLSEKIEKAKTINNDSAKKEIKSLEVLQQKHDSLKTELNTLVKGEIAEANEVLGLGYVNLYDGDNLHNTFCTSAGWLRSLGWILTALAISLGAPFWFDLLNKLMQLRGVVKRTGTDGEASKTNTSKTINPKG